MYKMCGSHYVDLSSCKVAKTAVHLLAPALKTGAANSTNNCNQNTHMMYLKENPYNTSFNI